MWSLAAVALSELEAATSRLEELLWGVNARAVPQFRRYNAIHCDGSFQLTLFPR